LGFDATLSPNGKLIAFTRGSCRVEREAYQGPANRDIWLYNITNDKFTQLTDFNGQDLAPQWGDNNTLYFQSARSGKYNIHKLKIDNTGNKTGAVEKISNLKEFGLFSYHLSKNGKDIVMTAGDNVWLLNAETKKTTPINIDINSDYRFDPEVRKTYRNRASEIAVSPNGKLSAFVVRGEIFVTENDKEKSRAINVSNSPYRDLDVMWLNNETLLFTSDRDGEYNLYTVTSSDNDNKNIFTSLKHKVSKVTSSKEAITNPTLSPNKEKISYNKSEDKLAIASISKTGKISNEKVLIKDWSAPSNVAWSPDSNWITYNQSDLYFNNEIYILKADGSTKPVNISMHPKGDFGAIWSKDGSKIVFSSNRNNSDYDVWFVWLKKEDWEKTKQDWDEATDEPKPKKEDEKNKKDKKGKDDEKKKDEVKPIVIDFEDIHERQQQVTSFTGGEFLAGVSKDGETIYYTTGNGSRGDAETTSDLFSIKWNGEDKKALTKGNTRPRSISLTPKNDYVYYIKSGRLNRIKVAGSKNESLPFAAKMVVDYNAESNQIFEEAWKVIRDRFYDATHHGQNWDALKKQYKPLALKASTRRDFNTVFNKMLGQVNASHMGLYSGENRAEVQRERTGILGVEFKATSSNKLQVDYVMPNSAADREASKLMVGDVVTSINGEKVNTSENVYQYLIDTGNEKILVGIERNGKPMEVIIRPKTSKRIDGYKAWVKERKRLTEKYSNGKLGYIHIQGMNWQSFERFERELMAAGHGKEGVVIDVRYNGGGWTTDYLMAVLNVKQHAYTVPRGAAKNVHKEHTNFTKYYPYSERLPLAAWTKPSVALCNQNSYSNAEIFSHAYKELGLGKLVGVPTFGAVISTGGQSLIDGAFVRVPFRGWFVKSSQKNMDFTPAMPDIVVYNAPDAKAKGEDTQLKTAVESLLKDL
ncbi:MAG TPA: S41 family peptidase, partial [Flavobacteriaceae bacterium]|nr:S41 family peptidase [Flavobacteriaceae bacterium]